MKITNCIPFACNWAMKIRRKPAEVRLRFFDTFLRMAEDRQWVPGEDAPEYDDYCDMSVLMESYHNGKQGGRPPKRAETPLETPLETPTETPTETERKKEGIERRSSTERKRPTLKQFLSQAKLAAIQPSFAEEQWYVLEADGWRDKNGSPIASPIRYLKTAWLAEQKKICAARENAESGGLFGTGIRVAAKRKAVR